jgi:hypothetical protein
MTGSFPSYSLTTLGLKKPGQVNRAHATREYGKGKIFRDRRIGLQQAAAKYFTKQCDQKLEGEFDRICTTADGFADRRNEVAHGIVMDVERIQFFINRLQLATLGERQALVVPPYHTVRNYDEVGHPEFAYNAQQLKTLASRLTTFGREIAAFRDGL